MNETNLPRQLAAETIGTALLVATVVGSGIMAEQLSGGNTALALFCNTVATAAMLIVLITILGPISGAHFNPAVSFVFALRREFPRHQLLPYIAAQIAGGIIGAMLANLMFDLPVLQFSTKLRGGTGQLVSEAVATIALLGGIFGGLRYKPDAIPMLVGLTIAAAYWFTASTSFANPAVTIARAFSNTFAGIAPESVLAFISVQMVGALIGMVYWSWLFDTQRR